MERPPDSDLDRFIGSEVKGALEALSTASADTPAWTWWSDPTARWIPRLLAHETSVHAWDATNALGQPITFEARMAADGIIEFFDIWIPYSGQLPEGLVGSIALDAVDAKTRWVVELRPPVLPTIIGSEATSVTTVAVRGTAAELLLLLWRRRPPSALTVSGERPLLERFLDYPILAVG
jgi:hypothetical protein